MRQHYFGTIVTILLMIFAVTQFSGCSSVLDGTEEKQSASSSSNNDNNDNNGNPNSGGLNHIPEFLGRYLGGNDQDRAQGNTTDGQHIVVAGNTHSSNFLALYGANTAGYKSHIDTTNGNSDAFAMVLTMDLQVVAWTYIGGNGPDRGYTARFDPQGNIVVCGFTESTNFEGAPVNGIRDAFVIKFTPDLKTKLWATTIGGSNSENPRNTLAINNNGDIYLSGETDSTDFPVLNALQPTYGGGTLDAFIVKFNSQGQKLWATYIGGPGTEYLWAEQVHTDGTIYVAGASSSTTGLPITTNAFQPHFAGGKRDGMIGRINPNGQSFVYFTYFGGSGDDMVTVNDPMAVNANGEAIVIGQTTSTNFPVSAGATQPNPSGAFDATNNVNDMYIIKFKADGTDLLAATYLGGNGHEESSGIAIDAHDEVYIGGNTKSTDFPTTAYAIQAQHANTQSSTQPSQFADGLIMKLNSDFSKLLFSSYFGGSGSCTNPAQCFGDRIREITLSPDAQWITFSGDTDSDDIFQSKTSNQTTQSQPFYGNPTDAIVLAFPASEL